jgi:hypothetical protein
MRGFYFFQKLLSSRNLAIFPPQKTSEICSKNIFIFGTCVKYNFAEKKGCREHHQGWMESNQEIIFCWVSVPFFLLQKLPLPMYRPSPNLLITYSRITYI